MKNLRLSLEEAVLGACLFENAYSRIAHILKSKNFIGACVPDPTITHERIFSIIEDLYTRQTVDLITVSEHYIQMFGFNSSINACLSRLYNMVSSDSNLVYHALALLEIDLKDKLLLLLIECRKQNEQNGNYESTEAISEVTESIMEGENIFEVIENSEIYFLSLRMDEEAAKIRDFKVDISKRIKGVKQVAQIELHARSIMRLAGTNLPYVQSLSQKLINGLIEVTVTGKLTSFTITDK